MKKIRDKVFKKHVGACAKTFRIEYDDFMPKDSAMFNSGCLSSPGVTWCFVTPEYPPTVGGVADYTFLVAAKFVEKGQKVVVLAPGITNSSVENGITIERILGNFGLSGFLRGSKKLNNIHGPKRLFLQWVPHGFGFKTVNLFVVFWIWWRVVVRKNSFWIMVHEPFLPFEGNLKQLIAASIHRVMIWILLFLAEKIFAGNKRWVELLKFWAPKSKKIGWVPVPSNIVVENNKDEIKYIHQKYAGRNGLIGHFGSYGSKTDAALEVIIPMVLGNIHGTNFLLLGKNSDIFSKKIIARYPDFSNRIFAPGAQCSPVLSVHLSACDLMIQPYLGGISTRNGSLMAVLSHGLPCIANKGFYTDPEWSDWNIVELVQADDFEKIIEKVKMLLGDPLGRAEKSQKIFYYYDNLFSLKKSVETFLSEK